jgi:L-fuconolactonase
MLASAGMEAVLDPDLPICDAHHHLWDRGAGDRYLLEDALADFSSGHNVVASVFVDSDHGYRSDGPPEMRPVGETAYIDRIATRGAAAAIVGRVDLTLERSVDRILEAHLAASPRRFRGLRHWLNNDPHAEAAGIKSGAPPGLAYDPHFRAGFARLERYGLVFDAWLYFTQLAELTDLARAFPGIAIALDHAGGLLGAGPYADRARYFDAWKDAMSELATCPNVSVKLGGMGSPRAGFGFRNASSEELARAWSPYFLHCIDRFGPERCMFESNYPPDRGSASYAVLWNAFKRIASGFSKDEKAALFHGTAMRVYRIE